MNRPDTIRILEFDRIRERSATLAVCEVARREIALIGPLESREEVVRRFVQGKCRDGNTGTEIQAHHTYYHLTIQHLESNFPHMPRIARIISPGISHHVTQRGNRSVAPCIALYRA
jgi:hypothetical protein